MARRWRFLILIFCISIAIGISAVILFLVILPSHTKGTPHYTAAQVTATAMIVNAHQVVQKTNQAALKQNWATLYTSSSQLAIGGLTQDQFEQMMTQQGQTEGTITSIVVTSTPHVVTDSDSTTYFTVHEKVTSTMNGNSQTQSMIAVYILENGVWKFLTSKTA